MVESPTPSVTMLPLTPDPLATPLVAGAAPTRNVMVLPLTVRVSPSAGWALPSRPVADVPLAAISWVVPSRADEPLPVVALEPTRDPWVAPSVIVAAAAVEPPAAPL